MKEVNQRFIKCLNDLISQGVVQDRAHFVEKMKGSRLNLQHLSGIATGRRNVTIQHLFFAEKVFRISSTYVISGIQPQFLTYNERSSKLEAFVASLKKDLLKL